MKTCRHFRNRIPQQEADALRAADPHPCELCDSPSQRRKQPVAVIWNPAPVRFRITVKRRRAPMRLKLLRALFTPIGLRPSGRQAAHAL